jgi:luciferase family oxidoreductase group 1
VHFQGAIELARDLEHVHRRAGIPQPPDVQVELQALLGPLEPGQRLRAIPGAGTNVPLWILGSSLFGAQLAAHLGLPFAFASHFAPMQMMEAIEIYRSRFQPSVQLDKPYLMLGANVVAAESDDEARYLFTSYQQSFVSLRRGRPMPVPPPVEGYELDLGPLERLQLQPILDMAIVGGPETVRRRLREFIATTGADEIIIASQVFDHEARVRSYEIAIQR